MIEDPAGRTCPTRCEKHLAHHDAVTAAFAGFSGLKNGKLLKACEDAGFEVLVTADRTRMMPVGKQSNRFHGAQ